MENLKHPHIAKNIVCSDLEDQIKAAFQRNIESGTDFTVSRFRQSLDSYVASLISSPKRMSANDSSEVKDHFCRGRKWVIVDNSEDLYDTVIKVAKDHNFDNLVDLFEKENKVWMRFQSVKSSGVIFTIHPESSNSQTTAKINLAKDVALSLNVLNGTPKSNGFEGEVKRKVVKKKSEVIEENNSDLSEKSEALELKEEVIKSEPTDNVEQINNLEDFESPETVSEWEQFLAAEGLDCDEEEENFEDDLFGDLSQSN